MRIVTAIFSMWICVLQAQETVIQAGYLVDPRDGTIQENRTIVVSGTRIIAIGESIETPESARFVDLSNSYVFPGLIDSHTHICNTVRGRDAGRYFYTGINASTAERAYACTAVRTAVNRREIVGPTIMNAGRIIAPFGAQYRLQPERRNLAEPDYFIADTRDEMLKAIRENIHFGARVLKVIVDDQSYVYSEEDLRFMRGEAEKAGFKLAAHAGTESGILNAANARVHLIEHVTNASEEGFRVMIENDVAAVFTNLPREYSTGPEELVERSYRRRNEQLKKAYDMGVKIVFGSDVMENKLGDRGESAMLVVNSYAEAGLTGHAILKSMTSDSAELLGIDNLAGHLAPNMWADIVATSINPLDDIGALHEIDFVMKWGMIVNP